MPRHQPHRHPVLFARIENVDQVEGCLPYDIHPAGILAPGRRAIQPVPHRRADVDGKHHLDGVPDTLHRALPRHRTRSGITEQPFGYRRPPDIRLDRRADRSRRPVDIQRHRDIPGLQIGVVRVSQHVQNGIFSRDGHKPFLHVAVGHGARQPAQFQRRGHRHGVGRALQEIAPIDEPIVIDDHGRAAHRHDDDPDGDISGRRGAPVAKKAANGAGRIPEHLRSKPQLPGRGMNGRQTGPHGAALIFGAVNPVKRMPPRRIAAPRRRSGAPDAQSSPANAPFPTQ